MTRLLRGLGLLGVGCLLAACGSAEDVVGASSPDDAQTDASSNAALTDKGGVVVSGTDVSDDADDADSAVEVVIYEDFQCPYCAQLEESSADFLEEQLGDGAVTVEYRIVSFLDGASTNEYSSRAANAALCVFDGAGPRAFYEFHATLYDNQPEEGSAGPEDAQLATYASDAGADVDDCITDDAMGDQVVKSTQQMTAEGVTGTPAVFVDGEAVELTSETSLQEAIEAAIG
ncbi:DsbA family protein [Solicola gregarius]|uniref:DsbA family protein n=1 Tax=Solicola gregarius TaxID=2908642 RepID=A0AA46TKU0_9ACTN|nr:DsbA family protein [Solicola gregarius]UYM07131.1 DsbA family protein [Solicola gregarius]